MTTRTDLFRIKADFPGLRAPATLLRMLMLSLLLCVVIIAGFFMFWSLTETLSSYRRQMNSAAFNAQSFITQQESLLKFISLSSVRETESAPASLVSKSKRGRSQIRTLTLTEHELHDRWKFILKELGQSEFDSAYSRLIYLTSDNGLIGKSYILDGFEAGLKVYTAFNGEWDQGGVDALLNQQLGTDAVWLSASTGNSKKIYMLRPVNQINAKNEWLGLELNQIDHAFVPSKLRQGKYVLYDASGTMVLHSLAWDVPDELSHSQATEDTFSVRWLNGLPEYIMLNKSIGGAGWRLIYYIPGAQLLRDTLLFISSALLSTLLLLIAIFLGARHIRLHLVEPAARHNRVLSESVSLNSRLIEVAPVGLCLIQCDVGALILSNESGRHWLASVPELRDKILDASHNGIRSTEHELPDGRFIQLKYAPTAYNEVDAILCCMSDVTVFKQAEQSLLLAKNLSDRANDEKALFLSTLSHEIRTPMYGILGSLEMLRTTAVSEQQSDYLEASQQASSALMRTINDSLDMSLIESGRLILNDKSFSPVHLVEEVALNYSARARSKGLVLYVTLDPSAPAYVRGDGERVRQILNNLVSNAIKFTESGHVVLRLNCEYDSTQRCQLRFQVVDTGPGIAHEFQASVFKPYFRVPTWLSSNIPGTGLGLAICARLAKLMSGSLLVFSEPGLGSSFSLNLTLFASTTSSKTEVPFLGAGTVYVCGDVPEVVQNLCDWLRRWGYLAIPSSQGTNVPTGRSVLLEAFLLMYKPVAWVGPRVVLHPPGVQPSLCQTSNSWVARTFSLDSVRKLVAQAHSGLVSELRFSPPTVLTSKMDLKLLAVDDSPLALQMIVHQTTYMGNKVVAVPSAIEALKRTDLLSFDVVLTDLKMQHMDGLSFARTLRDRGFGGLIIGITGEASPELRIRSESAGIRYLLIKPVPLDTLAEVLQSIKGKLI